MPLLKSAAAAGSVQVQSLLGWMYLRGEGTPSDPRQAAAWLRRAAAKGEVGAQYNLALDYGFMNNRFTGTIEYYVKNTKDLILTVTVPPPAPASTRLENVGKIRNRGLEWTLDAMVVSRPGLSWRAGLVFAA